MELEQDGVPVIDHITMMGWTSLFLWMLAVTFMLFYWRRTQRGFGLAAL